MLGPRLVNNAGADVPTTSLRGKVVALYFSASWYVIRHPITNGIMLSRELAVMIVLYMRTNKQPNEVLPIPSSKSVITALDIKPNH